MTTYVYAPTNRRDVYKRWSREDAGGASVYRWDDDNVVQQTDDLSTLEADYTVAPQPQGNLVSQHRDAESRFYHYDGRTHAAKLTDGSEVVTDDYVLDAWGTVKAETAGSIDNPFVYMAQKLVPRDNAMGSANPNHWARARFYSPGTGRWRSEDPIRDDEENLYRYAGNDGVGWIDSNGAFATRPMEGADDASASRNNGRKGVTFGQLIKEGKLPGSDPQPRQPNRQSGTAHLSIADGRNALSPGQAQAWFNSLASGPNANSYTRSLYTKYKALVDLYLQRMQGPIRPADAARQRQATREFLNLIAALQQLDTAHKPITNDEIRVKPAVAVEIRPSGTSQIGDLLARRRVSTKRKVQYCVPRYGPNGVVSDGMIQGGSAPGKSAERELEDLLGVLEAAANPLRTILTINTGAWSAGVSLFEHYNGGETRQSAALKALLSEEKAFANFLALDNKEKYVWLAENYADTYIYPYRAWKVYKDAQRHDSDVPWWLVLPFADANRSVGGRGPFAVLEAFSGVDLDTRTTHGLIEQSVLGKSQCQPSRFGEKIAENKLDARRLTLLRDAVIIGYLSFRWQRVSANGPVSYKRPSGYRKGVRDQVWENAKGPDGLVRDPKTNTVMNKSDPWHMGHKPGYEFRKHAASAKRRGISRQQFLDEHNNPEHYRPELPSSNLSHSGELPDNVYYGP